MKKILLFCICTLCFIVNIFAGGLLTNTNQSIHFLRNPARDASTEIDAAYTNPAGLAKLPVDGFYFSFNNQSAFQTRTITSTFTPFAGFGGNTTKVFEGKASAPIIPSLHAAYKTEKWILSGNIALSGGGGKATFNKGLPSFEAGIAMLPVINTNTIGIPTSSYSLDSYMDGKSYIYGAQLGGTYSINDMFAGYAGFRLNIVHNGYYGYMKGIQINPQHPLLNPSGGMMSATDFYTALAAATGNASVKKMADATKDMELDCSQSGWGVTPVLGFNFNWNNLNAGVKYEFKSTLDIENKTKVNTLPEGKKEAFDDGVNTPHDIPALLTIGVSYKFINCLTVSAGFHHFFDSNAKMANDKQNYINGGTTELSGGIEWQIDKMFLISGGFQTTGQGVTNDYQTDMSFSLNSYSIGLGGAVNVSNNVRINLGYFWTNYSDWTKESINYNETKLQGIDVFSRTNKVFGAGVDFKF